MRISTLEQLVAKGMVFIQKEGDEYLVECVHKDKYGFLADCVWGESLNTVLKNLLEED